VVAEAAGSAIVEGRSSYGLQELASEPIPGRKKRESRVAAEVEEELAARVAGLGSQLFL
jgi:hypothetical protein